MGRGKRAHPPAPWAGGICPAGGIGPGMFQCRYGTYGHISACGKGYGEGCGGRGEKASAGGSPVPCKGGLFRGGTPGIYHPGRD